MKVKELIENLQQFDPELECYLENYEETCQCKTIFSSYVERCYNGNQCVAYVLKHNIKENDMDDYQEICVISE